LHAGLEAFSGEINWLKIWWTNKIQDLLRGTTLIHVGKLVVGPFIQPQNPLINCKKLIIGIPIITQSDPGTENYGVANAHTII
jgi:hypothetical protein